eukprot:1153656-Pelagomonas_calceolata.AAC.1
MGPPLPYESQHQAHVILRVLLVGQCKAGKSEFVPAAAWLTHGQTLTRTPSSTLGLVQAGPVSLSALEGQQDRGSEDLKSLLYTWDNYFLFISTAKRPQSPLSKAS